ncbi:S-layer family protein [Massilia sp. BJB1822]|uniref:beta strand repeat-containing protein n=1 Tax=Massilia sp. BJB1822 TaxID=2744470 RepID=UPI0015930122|nr:DUF4214 domain-containing protein [Massilia sp. BJB1822]NVE01395.1 DUF4214 domain-containing protein [Massilia sp. BJB1822]
MAAADYIDVAQQLYVSYFGRPADPYGLDNYTKQLDALKAPKTLAELDAIIGAKSNQALTNLVNSFNTSKEAIDLYGNDNSQIGVSKFVAALYQNIFGREADIEGAKWWIDEIASGRTTRANAALAITQGAFNNTSDQAKKDQAAVTNKLGVAKDFTTNLDTITEINAFSGDAAAAAARGLLAGVSNATVVADYHATVVATIANIVVITTPTQTTTLTANADTLAGTGGNDIFDGSKADTLSSFDSIDGGAGNDVINAVLTGSTLPGSLTIKNVETLNVSTTGAGLTVDSTGFTGMTQVNAKTAGAGAVSVTAAATTGVTVAAQTGASATVKEVFKATFGTNTDADTVTFDGVAVILTAAQTAIQNAAKFVAAYNLAAGTHWVAVDNADGTVTFTAKTGGVVTDVVTGDFAITSGGAGADVTVTAAAPTTQGAVTPGASTVTVIGGGTTAVLSTGAVAGQHITVGGTAVANAFTSVSTVGGDQVNITDRSGASAATGTKLTNVSLNGNIGTATIVADGLTSLSVANTSSNVNVTAAAGTRVQTLSLDTVTGGTITDNTATTLAVKAVGGTSSGVSLAAGAAKTVSIDGGAKATITDIAANVATTLTVTGAKAVTVSGLSAVGALTTVDATGSAGGVTITPVLGNAVVFKGGAGNDTISLGASTVATDMGAGNNTVILAGALGAGGTVKGGSGTSDTLSMTVAAADAADADATFKTAVTGFEILKLTGGVADTTVDVAALGGFNAVTTGGQAAGKTLSLANLASNGTLTLTSASTGAYTISNAAFATQTADVLNIKTTAAATAAFGTVNISNVETVNVTTTDTSSAPDGSVAQSLVILDGNGATTLKVSGTAATGLTFAGTGLTTVDASGLNVAGAGAANTGLTWTSGALTAAVTIKGSANGGDVIDAQLATKAVTITETAGTNTIKGSTVVTGGVAVTNTLTGGTGADTIYGGAGKDVIVGGGGADVIIGNAGADLITVSGNKATIKQVAAGDSGANTSTTIQTSELTSTFDVVKGVVAGDKIDLSFISAFTTSALVLNGTNLAAADNKVVFASGTYDAAAGTFTFAANGADTAVTYDTNTTGTIAGETIILVGFHADATNTTAAGGIVTLA